MTAYTEFFLNSRKDVAQLELLEITHPNFTKPYRIVRNCRDGVTVDLSPTELGIFFEFWPAKFTGKAARTDLDYSITIDLGDVGEVIPTEVDAVAQQSGFSNKIELRYWVFRSDDLTAPIFGPIRLEGSSLSFDGAFSTIEAKAPSLNTNKTGERYTVERFPMLKGFLK